MINSPNIVGPRTSIAASRTMASFDSPGAANPSRRTQFSTMITELSTTRPKSMAPRLMRLAEIPVIHIRFDANSIDSGIARETIKPARTFPRRTRSTPITNSPPSARLWITVSSVRAISSERS